MGNFIKIKIMRRTLLFVLTLCFTASILADGYDDADQPTLAQGTFHVPSFYHGEECREHSTRFNIFMPVGHLQNRCGGDYDGIETTNDGSICGSSERPWCSNEGDELECVETKPADHFIVWVYSLPLEAELTECLNDTENCVNDAWKTSIPTATLTADDGTDTTIQCLPTPYQMPSFTCTATYVDDSNNQRTIVPNIASIRPAQWSSCGVDVYDGTQSFYCTNPLRPHCHIRDAENQTLNACLVEAAVVTDGNAFDYSTWETSGDQCFKDLNEFDQGTFMMEVKLWTYEYLKRGQDYTDYRTQLDAAIQDMKDSVTVRDMELVYGQNGQSGKKIKMPINCPPPPEISLIDWSDMDGDVNGSLIIPCLSAAASAKRISNTVAYIDNIKVDHTMKEALKTKDYRMIAEMTECSSGKKHPCAEEVLYHKPNVDDYSLHCFQENNLMSSINVDFSCFKKGFLKDYYNEFRNYLEATAVKWISFIEKNIFPRELCDTYKYEDSGVFIGYANKDEFFKACLQERSKLSGRDESLICGGTTCCNNAETHSENLVCTNMSIDHSKGTWASSVTTGECDLDCDISDLELQIWFNYNDESAKTGEILVEAENDVTGRTTSEILTSMVSKADNPVDVCLLNTVPGQTCGFSYLDNAAGPDGDKTRVTDGVRNAHYCQQQECCVKTGNDFTCQAQTGTSCDANTTVIWFNKSQHAECQKVQKNNEGEVVSETAGDEGAAPSQDQTGEGDGNQGETQEQL